MSQPNGISRAETVVRRIDRFQQRHTVLGLPFAVVQKFGNDQAGGKATIIAFYGLFAVFPLLLLFSTILGFVLGSHPDLEQQMINSALADFPILGTQLRSSTHPLRGNGVALVLGILGALYGAQGLGQAAQNAMNTVWNVPFKDWPGFVGRRVRGLTILVLLGVGILVSTTLIGLASRFGPLSGTWATAAGAVVNFAVFMVSFTVLTSKTVRVRDVAVGAVIATVFWEILQRIGDWFVRYTLAHTTDVYGFFAIVLGLLSWLYLGARLTLLAAEINVVLRYRLWPRSLTQPPFTPQDKTAMTMLAKMEERRPEETVEVAFSAEADRQPLDAPTPPPRPDPAERSDPNSPSAPADTD
ncbi:YihY/virulence factor BrkB family protein [Rhodococcus pyridinivorans]|uniref:YihY/virulence factor BrkB family protein n=1 Tax=Rhodococcus pyridinivorans TaxID=103816 RepID=UPI0039B59ADE